jgi:hypothetical protein
MAKIPTTPEKTDERISEADYLKTEAERQKQQTELTPVQQVAQPIQIAAGDPYPTQNAYAVATQGVPMNQPPPLGWPGAITSPPADVPPNTPNRLLRT